jgi:hypothetical protein
MIQGDGETTYKADQGTQEKRERTTLATEGNILMSGCTGAL